MPWLYGAVVIHCCGCTVLWLYNAVVVRCYGCMVLRLYSAVAVQCCGCTMLWLYSAMAVVVCCRSVVGQDLFKSFPDNNLQLMVESGAKGSMVSH